MRIQTGLPTTPRAASTSSLLVISVLVGLILVCGAASVVAVIATDNVDDAFDEIASSLNNNMVTAPPDVTYQLAGGSALDMAVSNDGSRAAFATVRGDIEVIAASTAEVITMQTVTESAFSFRDILFTESNDTLLIATDERVFRWNISDNAQTNLFGIDVDHAAFSANGRFLATATDAGEISLYALPAGELLVQRQAAATVAAIYPSPNGSYIAIMYRNVTETAPAGVQLLSFDLQQIFTPALGISRAINNIAWIDDSRFALVTEDGARAYTLTAGDITDTVRFAEPKTRTLSYEEVYPFDDAHVLVGNFFSEMYRYNVNTGELVWAYGTVGGPDGVGVGANGRNLVILSAASNVGIWREP